MSIGRSSIVRAHNYTIAFQSIIVNGFRIEFPRAGQMPMLPDLRLAASSLFDSKNLSTAAAWAAMEAAS